MELTRRAFLTLGGLLMIPGLARPAALRHLLRGPTGPTVQSKPLPVNPFTRDGKSLVGIVKGRDPALMAKAAIEAIGGLDRLNLRGKSVLIKPNVVAGDPPPTTTNPVLVASMVRLCREAGARRVIVGDRSAIMTLPTRKNLEATGIDRAAREAGAEVVAFEDGAWVRVEPPQARYATRYWVARPAYEADVLINMPVVKTHRSATYTICLKNLVGIVHPRNTPWLVSRLHWEEVIAELNLAVHPHLNVVDATRCMISGGPWNGRAADAHLVIASGDRVAADVVGLGLLKTFVAWPRVVDVGVWEQRQVRRAVELGLGAAEGREIEIVASAMDGEDAGFRDVMERIRASVFESGGRS